MSSYKGIFGKISKKSDNEVEWTIPNFSSYTVEDEAYNSPNFSISSNEWCMVIFPNGQNSENKGWISLYLCRVSDDDEEEEEKISSVTVNYSFGIKKEDGKVKICIKKCIWHFYGASTYGYHQFLQRSELQRRKSELLSSDALTLACKLRTPRDMESCARLNTLRDFADLYISKRGCDATLKVKREEFPVHKLILSARSPVFASMFEVDMKEKRTGVVDIPDCDPKVFREFLLYLYSGNLKKVPSNATELYKIADKYRVEDLKPFCLMSIFSHLTVENFFDAVEFGRFFSLEEIKERTQYFFNQNFTKILKTDEWFKFMKEKPSVANEFLQCKVKKMETDK